MHDLIEQDYHEAKAKQSPKFPPATKAEVHHLEQVLETQWKFYAPVDTWGEAVRWEYYISQFPLADLSASQREPAMLSLYTEVRKHVRAIIERSDKDAVQEFVTWVAEEYKKVLGGFMSPRKAALDELLTALERSWEPKNGLTERIKASLEELYAMEDQRLLCRDSNQGYSSLLDPGNREQWVQEFSLAGIDEKIMGEQMHLARQEEAWRHQHGYLKSPPLPNETHKKRYKEPDEELGLGITERAISRS